MMWKKKKRNFPEDYNRIFQDEEHLERVRLTQDVVHNKKKSSFLKKITDVMFEEVKARGDEMTIERITRAEIVKDGMKFIVKVENGKKLIRLPIPISKDAKNSITNDTQQFTVNFECIDNNNMEYQIKNIPTNLLNRRLNDDELIEKASEFPGLLHLLEFFLNDPDNIVTSKLSFPTKFDFEDITDNEFNGYHPIPRATLVDVGMWITNGKRKLQVEITTDNTNLYQRFYDKDKKDKTKFGLKFTEKDQKPLANPIEFEGLGDFNNNTKDKIEFFIEVDTDKIGKEVTETSFSIFYGSIVLELVESDLGFERFESIELAVEIRFVNPSKSANLLNTNTVSIDFGTSSTCIACNGGDKLISFTDKITDRNKDYENPTSFIIYNWEKIFKTWDPANEAVPHFHRARDMSYKIKNTLDTNHYGDGNNVNVELGELANNPERTDVLKAIVTDIKALPGKLAVPNAREQAEPYRESDAVRTINMICDVGNDTIQNLNPISLYAYFIGRAVNANVNDQIFLNYKLSFPVTFNENKRKIIRDSFEYGLKRSVPHIIREKVQVEMGREEPVAILGAARRHIVPESNQKPILFAVFDFGGGTLDFAFGMCRHSVDNSDLKDSNDEPIDEFFYGDYMIEIFRTDGEPVGGETLINLMSYQIYKDNKGFMDKNNIPIEVPTGELPIQEGIRRGLMRSDIYAKINLRIINEEVSRKAFKGNLNLDTLSSGSVPPIEQLLNQDGDKVSIRESDLEDFSEDELIKKLVGSKIQKLVQSFKT
ncbi:MAG: hypothetical protein IPM51_12370, partial [Sphingobacteriaceae bacterium]|nr:hypothetical protein [Sphingobacteriaceae bacterium]